jgi:hypothetical protein
MSDLVKQKLSNFEKKLEKNKASKENVVNNNEIQVNEVVDEEKRKTRKRTNPKTSLKEKQIV